MLLMKAEQIYLRNSVLNIQHRRNAMQCSCPVLVPPLCVLHCCTKVGKCCLTFINHVWAAAYPQAFSKADWSVGPGSSTKTNKIPWKVLKTRVWPLFIQESILCWVMTSDFFLLLRELVIAATDQCVKTEKLRSTIKSISKDYRSKFMLLSWLSMWFCHKNCTLAELKH